MFSALSWLLDLHPAYSSSSSSSSAAASDCDSESHSGSTGSQRSTTSSSSGHNTALPHSIPPTTFTNKNGQRVAELHVASHSNPTAYVSHSGGSWRSSQHENALFPDLYVQSSALFSAAEPADDLSFSAMSPQTTVHVWNLSTYASDTVSVSPLPSPSYAQAPANPAAAFYSLAEHGTTVLTPPLGIASSTLASTAAAAAAAVPSASTKAAHSAHQPAATATPSAGRTLFSSDAVTLSACFPPAAPSRTTAATTRFTTTAAATPRVSADAQGGEITVAAKAAAAGRDGDSGGGTRVQACAATPPPPPLSSSQPSASRPFFGVGYDLSSAVVITPETRILEWDQEVRQRRFSIAVDDLESPPELPSPPYATAAATVGSGGGARATDGNVPSTVLPVAAAADVLMGSLSLPSPTPGSHVVQLHPSNPFLQLTESPAAERRTGLAALPSSSPARPFGVTFTAAAGISTAAQPSHSVHLSLTAPTQNEGGDSSGGDGDGDGQEREREESVVVLSLSGAANTESLGLGGDAHELMAAALRQRTSELLGEGTTPSRRGSGQASTAARAGLVVEIPPNEEAVSPSMDRLHHSSGAGHVVQLGGGVVTLTAQEATVVDRPSHKASR